MPQIIVKFKLILSAIAVTSTQMKAAIKSTNVFSAQSVFPAFKAVQNVLMAAPAVLNTS